MYILTLLYNLQLTIGVSFTPPTSHILTGYQRISLSLGQREINLKGRKRFLLKGWGNVLCILPTKCKTAVVTPLIVVVGPLSYNTYNIIITDYFFNLMVVNKRYSKFFCIKEAEHRIRLHYRSYHNYSL